MGKKGLLIFSCLLITSTLFSQSVSINTDGSAPDPSSVLDIKSSSGGLLIPRMTTAEMNAIPSPAVGLVVFVTDAAVPGIYYNTNTPGSPVWSEVKVDRTISTIQDDDGDTYVEVVDDASGDTINFVVKGYKSFSMDTNNFYILPNGFDGGLIINSTGGDYDSYIQFKNENTSVFTFGVDDSDGDKLKIGTTGLETNTRITIDGNGNVGIGTSAPAYSFQVGGTGGVYNGIKVGEINSHLQGVSGGIVINSTGGNYDARLSLQNDSTTQYTIGVDDSDDDKFKIGTTDLETNTRFTIDTNGNVGIGTSAPAYGLQVGGTGGVYNGIKVGEINSHLQGVSGGIVINSTGGNYDARLSLQNDSNTLYTIGIDDSDDDKFKIGTTSLETNTRFTIDTNGNVGIGTDSPTAKLDIDGDIRTDHMVLEGISDLDGNTSIEVDLGGSNDDIIHFKTGGNEYFSIDGTRINVVNTGGSVFIGESAGISDDLTNNTNVAIGDSTLKNNVTGIENVAIGNSALKESTGSFNIALGGYALANNTTGYDNIALGSGALTNNTTGYHNIAIGNIARNQGSTGRWNISIGTEANSKDTGGDFNVIIGHNAGGNVAVVNHSKYRNVMIGQQSGFFTAAGADANVFIGYQSGFFETGSNKLYIENTNSSSPLISAVDLPVIVSRITVLMLGLPLIKH